MRRIETYILDLVTSSECLIWTTGSLANQGILQEEGTGLSKAHGLPWAKARSRNVDTCSLKECSLLYLNRARYLFACYGIYFYYFFCWINTFKSSLLRSNQLLEPKPEQKGNYCPHKVQLVTVVSRLFWKQKQDALWNEGCWLGIGDCEYQRGNGEPECSEGKGTMQCKPRKASAKPRGRSGA